MEDSWTEIENVLNKLFIRKENITLQQHMDLYTIVYDYMNDNCYSKTKDKGFKLFNKVSYTLRNICDSIYTKLEECDINVLTNVFELELNNYKKSSKITNVIFAHLNRYWNSLKNPQVSDIYKLAMDIWRIHVYDKIKMKLYNMLPEMDRNEISIDNL